MRRWPADLSGMGGIPNPAQYMVNLFSTVFAISIPFVAIEPLASRERPNDARRARFPNRVRDSNKRASLKEWLLYAIRFIMTGCLGVAW